jgi:hypothetical protein
MNEGNGPAEKKWRAQWDPRKFSKPSPGNAAEIRNFVKKTYVEKIWCSTVSSPVQSSFTSNELPKQNSVRSPTITNPPSSTVG